jgi:hypothetical protein
MAALATVLAAFAGADLVSEAEAHGIGGVHIGGLGGLHIGGFHGGFHGGGFHGGGFHSGGFHSGNFHGGGFYGGSTQAGGYRGGATSLGGARAAGGGVGTSQVGQSVAGSQSFASRYRVSAVGMNLGSGNSASKIAAAPSGKSSVVQAAHMTGGAKKGAAAGGANAAAAKSGSTSNNLALGTGNLVSRKGSTGILIGGLGLYGPGFGYGYGGYGGNGYGPYGYSYCSYYGLAGSNNVNSATILSGPPAAPITLPSGGGSLDFSALAETQFKAGNYAAAVSAWRHALLDDSKSPVLVLLYAQGLFATGKFDEAAGAVQQALRQLPDDKWGVVVSHYGELYRGNQDYTDQLRALELARNNPETDSPAVRFLLGYHYGYLGYPKHAVAELDKTLAAVADDSIARQLREIMAAKSPAASEVAPPAAPSAK